MTNQEQYENMVTKEEYENRIVKQSEEIKDLVYRLDKTTKQRNALIIGLNYVNNTINAIDACWKYHPEYAEGFYKKSICYMKEVMKNALLKTVDNSEGTIKMEVKEDDN